LDRFRGWNGWLFASRHVVFALASCQKIRIQNRAGGGAGGNSRFCASEFLLLCRRLVREWPPASRPHSLAAWGQACEANGIKRVRRIAGVWYALVYTPTEV
jgi:hypothetical protein